MRILLVEDTQDTRHLFSMAFVLAGHRALTASSGQEALEMLQNEIVDVVVLDIQMPRMSGWDVLQQIRESPLTAHLPVVVLTAFDEELVNAQHRELGAYALLRKPIMPQSLLEIVEEAAQAGR